MSDATAPPPNRDPHSIRVLLIDGDEHEAIRSEAALALHLGDALELRRANSLSEAIHVLTDRMFDVVLLEPALGDSSGIATLTAVRGAAPGTPVVVYTRLIDDDVAIRAIHAGAQECLAKQDSAPQTIARALQFAIERQRRLTSLEAARVDAAHRATHDPLTGLANRELFLEQFAHALAFGARYGRKTGLLFVDLDGFKSINDVHGHTCGDTLLRVVANRMLECVRRSDAVARLGGDEFVVLLSDVTSRRDVAHVRETILASLREPIDAGGTHTVRVEASVGCAMSPLDGQAAQELLDAADADMYRDKEFRRHRRSQTPALGMRASGGASSAAPDGNIDAVPNFREARMREAMRAGEFLVHFQPVIDVVSNRILAVEALLRWQDTDRGLLRPASFLSLAEDTGLIVPIGEMVLRQACQSIVQWRALPTYAAMRVAVNVSAVQLREPEFVGRVAAILQETGCPTEALTLELTENSTHVDGDIAIEALHGLKALGTRLVVDDFGVGYASLSFVREAPVDGIKLDRRFVLSMLTDPRDLAIISSMVRLAHGLRLDMVAEGVESGAQSERLARLGCTAQQGRFFSDALPAEQMEALLRRAATQLATLGSSETLPALELGGASRAWRARIRQVSG